MEETEVGPGSVVIENEPNNVIGGLPRRMKKGWTSRKSFTIYLTRTILLSV